MEAKKTGRFRLSAAALADSSDDRHGAKDFGPSRKGLFYRPNMSDGRVLLIPQIQRRGAKGERLYYYTHGHHWVEVPDNSEKGSHREGKTCWHYIKHEQPAHYERLLEESEYTEESARCFFCELLDSLYDPEAKDWVGIPKQTMKIGGRMVETKRPEFAMDKSFNVPVIMPEDRYEDDDEYSIKIYPARITVIKAMDKLLQKYFPDLLDPELNQWVDITLADKKYNVQVLPPQLVKEEGLKLWVPDWEKHIPDMEDLSPNLSTYEEQETLVREHYPNIYEFYQARKGDATTRKTAPKTRARKTTTKATTAKKTTTRSRKKATS